MGADMSHRLIDAAPSNASELSAYVESLREHLLAHPEEWEQVTLDQYLEAFAAVLRDHQGPSPLGQSRLLEGHERESMPYARPCSTAACGQHLRVALTRLRLTLASRSEFDRAIAGNIVRIRLSTSS
jgi:hypothetical protein